MKLCKITRNGKIEQTNEKIHVKSIDFQVAKIQFQRPVPIPTLPFQNVFPRTVVVGSALFFERVVREWRVGRECPRQHTEHVIMMEMKILTFVKHVVLKICKSQPVNLTPGRAPIPRKWMPLG